MQGLEILMRDRTTIMITHSLALAQTADRVVEIGDGHILRQGSPQELEADLRRIRSAEAAVVTAGRVGPPPDVALPQMPRLLDPAEMAPVLQRSLGWDAPPPEVRIRYLRYKPRKDLVVHYGVTINDALYDAVAIIAARRDLSRWAAEPTYRRFRRVGRRSRTGDRAASYDPELDTVIMAPLDIGLPALAQHPPASTAPAGGRRARPGSGEGAGLLAYKPRRELCFVSTRM